MILHCTTQHGTQLKTYELLTSGIFHLIFLDLGWPQVTETKESKPVDKGRMPVCSPCSIIHITPWYSAFIWDLLSVSTLHDVRLVEVTVPSPSAPKSAQPKKRPSINIHRMLE